MAVRRQDRIPVSQCRRVLSQSLKIALPRNYSTRYRPELDLVLNNISLEIVRSTILFKSLLTPCQKPREKLGVVGRTGRASDVYRSTELTSDQVRGNRVCYSPSSG